MKIFYSVLLSSALLASAANAVSITVSGTANPYLAGMPDGSTASGGDSAPGQSPVEINNIPTTGGGSVAFLSFEVRGAVSNSGGTLDYGPDGGEMTAHFAGDTNGLSNIKAPLGSLLGVFLGDDQPDISAAPPSLDFDDPIGSGSGLEFVDLKPRLKQVFFIGDGQNSAGRVQSFMVPTGATRIFLGTMDGSFWSDNSGAFDVSVQALVGDSIPLPLSGVLLLSGIGMLALGRRRKG